jgi:hypothetical protein
VRSCSPYIGSRYQVQGCEVEGEAAILQACQELSKVSLQLGLMASEQYMILFNVPTLRPACETLRLTKDSVGSVS